jgi:hypothetical protein
LALFSLQTIIFTALFRANKRFYFGLKHTGKVCYIYGLLTCLRQMVIMAIINPWYDFQSIMIVVLGFAGLGLFFAWGNRKIMITIVVVTLGFVVFGLWLSGYLHATYTQASHVH